MNEVLKGKNCLITGATGALGSSLAKKLREKGCKLFLTSTNEEKLSELSKPLSAYYKKTDLGDSSQVQLLINEVIRSEMQVDILVNSAGIFSIGDMNKDAFEHMMKVNVYAPYALCQCFSERMKKRRWGRIINVGSSSSYSGFKGGTAYCSTKHAILGLSRSLHEEVKDHGVQVCCVSPGSMKSEMSKISVDQDFETFLEPEDVADQIVNVLSMPESMICNELRLNRTVIR
jgi:3-oxoacyl-[acyl-carrier protein] reductase